MTWLKQQAQEKLLYWISRTRTPMLATRPDGEILWANHSFERLLGYTSVELVGKKTWIELTLADEDLQVDKLMVDRLVSGFETSYQLQKHFMTKSGLSRPVVVDVLRYPLKGEFDCFLVAVIPVEQGVELAIAQIGEIRKLLVEMMDKTGSGLTLPKVMDWSKKHPVIAAIISTLLGVLLFGERFVEILKMLGLKFGNGQ